MYQSPFIFETPFLKGGKEIADISYPNGKILKGRSTTVVPEPPRHSEPYTKKVTYYRDKNADGKYSKDDDDELISKAEIIIIASKDYTYLKKLFDKSKPTNYEVCIFIEDNSDDFLSDGSAFIKIGKSIRTVLKKQRLKDKFKKILLDDKKLKKQFKDFTFEFSEKLLEELITKGELSNISRDFAIGLIQSTFKTSILLGPVMSLIGTGVLGFTKILKKYIKFQPYHWDAAAKIPDPKHTSKIFKAKMVENKNFEPALFPLSNTVIDKVGGISEKDITTLAIELKQKLKEMEKDLNARLTSY